MIPSRVKVGGLYYDVEEKEVIIIDDNKNYQGACHYTNTTIELLKTLSNERKEEVFSHELTHAIFEQAGYDDQDEDMVNRIGKVLHQFLKDNTDLFSEWKIVNEVLDSHYK